MILVTGSEGLIGKTLGSQLEKLNRTFKSFDIRHIKPNDICNKDQITACLQDCEGIVHLAGISRVILGEQNPQKCWLNNAMGTAYVLQTAYKLPHKPWVIYASSREVYGQQEQFPVKETALLKPLNTYALSKAAAEGLVHSYQNQGLRTQILRFSSVYGRVDDHVDRVIPAFCRAALLNKPLRIEGSKNQFDFTHVLDVAAGIIKTIEAIELKEKLPSAIHFTTGIPTTLKETALLACQFSGNDSELTEAPSRNFDVSQFYGDPSLAEKALGWKSTINLQAGIKNLIQAFTQELTVLDGHSYENT